MSGSVTTIGRHIIDQERHFPEATGVFSGILYDIALAGKIISREVNKAGLGKEILGSTESTNVHGELVQKLDEYANQTIFNALDHTGYLACMASEENEKILAIPDKFPAGNYVLLFDPLDGSSNIEANVSIGTIFSLHKKVSDGDRGTEQDCLQPGSKQVAAGYIVYGSSTMLVYTTGNGVHGFTLDPSIGEFLLSHPDIQIPDPGQRIYSINEGNTARWSEQQRRLVEHLKGVDGENSKPFSSRYIGSLVSDVHRLLIYGGLFMYPGQSDKPAGKLRLLYEASPLAFVCEHAGGRATDGTRSILDVEPTDLHQRTPLFLGSSRYMDLVDRFLSE